MPTPTLSLQIRNAIVDVDGVGKAQVEITVIDSTDIDRRVFVYDTENQAYQHVATVRDMRDVVMDYTTARDTDVFFYRTPYVLQTFDTLDAATIWRDSVVASVTGLAQQWKTYLDGFPTEEILTIQAV